MDSSFEITGAPAEDEVCNAILNPQTLGRAFDVDDVGGENRARYPSDKEIVDALSVLGNAVQHRADE